MSDELIYTGEKPTYTASVALEAGGTARVTVVSGAVLFDVRNDDGHLIPARLTDWEAHEIGSILYAAERNTHRG